MNNNYVVDGEFNGTNKSNKGIIVLLVLVIIALAGYIVYDKVLSKNESGTDTKVNDTSKDPVEGNKEKEEDKEKVIKVDENKVNEQLSSLNMALKFTFEDIEVGRENVSYDKELLVGDAKFNLVWAIVATSKDKYNIEFDEDYNYIVDYGVFKNAYKELIGEEFDGKFSDRYDFKIDNGKLVGNMYSGWTMSYSLSVNKVVLKEDQYIVTVDVENIKEAKNEEAKLQIIAVKNNDSYTFKSIKIVK